MRFLMSFLLVIDLRFILDRTVASSFEMSLSLFSKSSPLTLNITFQIRENNPLRSFFWSPLSTAVPWCSFSPTAIYLKIKLENPSVVFSRGSGEGDLEYRQEEAKRYASLSAKLFFPLEEAMGNTPKQQITYKSLFDLGFIGLCISVNL